MQTSGHGNDALMILIGVSLIGGVILLGGPANALEAVNNIVRDVANETMALVSAWF
jgi:DMSO reductase anchor subunit